MWFCLPWQRPLAGEAVEKHYNHPEAQELATLAKRKGLNSFQNRRWDRSQTVRQ
jgi:hypothetical protein